MPPKAAKGDSSAASLPSDSPLVAAFVAAGLAKAKAEATAKNSKQSAALAKIVNDNDITDAAKNPKQGNLLIHLVTVQEQAAAASSSGASEEGTLTEEHVNILAKAIHDGRLQSADQVNAGVSHLRSGGDKSEEAFNKASGVGVTVPQETITSTIASYMSENAAALAESTWNSLPSSMTALKLTEELRWANPLEIKQSIESAFTAAFGTKDEFNKANKANAAAAKAAKASAGKGADSKGKGPAAKGDAAAAVEDVTSSTSMFEAGFLDALHPVGGNPQIHPHLREEHMRATGGLVHTRFPPEPNGYLHIGHSKAIAINFGFAQYHNGHCYLRYDDTNPEAEEQVYIDSILDIIRWLGFEPWKITYSSDHFQKLYDLAEELIRRGKAYMCYCTGEEISANRGGPERGPRVACKHRDAAVAENLSAFQDMKAGKFAPSEAVLRMKQDLGDGNPQMWDLVAYRTLKKPHHRTGTDWCIYPTYDFTHCLCDSFENITHSLCTVEFVLSRQSYDWLCDALEVYKPRQSEYGRLKLQGTLLSKRRIMKIVQSGVVQGWDDPRLYTLIAQRRRGVPPGAILSFVNSLGVTTTNSTITTHRYEQTIRAYLETTTPRLMLVLKPLKVTLVNVPDGFEEEISKPLHSKDASFGNNVVYLTKHVYVDQTDFRQEDSKDFFRLAPGKTVGLLYCKYPITCTDFKTDPATGEVTEVIARYEGFTDAGEAVTTAPGKVKTYIHWVAEHAASSSPVKVDETRVFKQLFKSDDPDSLKGEELLANVDPDSLQVVKSALIEVGIWELVKRVKDAARSGRADKEQDQLTSDPKAALTGGKTGGNERVRFQGLRTAYFCLDSDARVPGLTDSSKGEEESRIVLNWIVSLKEDKTK